jgi:MoaA/NifB/PqqE/SkfB family radical SAM enzyme
MSIYSQAKPLYHIDRIDALRRGILPAPVHVQLILSDLCNQDCSFCAYRMSGGLSTEMFADADTGHHNPNRRIETDKAIEILEDCHEMGVRAIQFTGGGEPTAHRDWDTLIHIAQKFGMETGLVTNGVRLKWCEAVEKLTWLRVSVDAGSEAAYTRIRRVSPKHWKWVWGNIETIATVYTGTFGVGYVVTPDNYGGISACAKRARNAGVDNFRIGAVFSSHGLDFYSGVRMEWILEEIEKAKELETDDFKIMDLFGRRFGDLEAKSPEHEFCGYQYFTTYIGADLNVYRCCNTAYTKKGMLGSLKDTRLRDFVPQIAPFDARKCTYCQFQGQNEAINAVLQAPEHPEFV